MQGKYVIVRGKSSGIFAGVLESQNGSEVVLRSVRRLWQWVGATESLQLAMEGVKQPDECKFTMTADAIKILDAVEVIPATAAAEENIKMVPVWKI